MTRFAPRTYRWPVVALVLALLALAGCGGGHHRPPKPTPKVVTLGGPGHKKITLPPPAQKIVRAKPDEAKLHERTLPSAAAQKQAKKLKPPGQPTVPQSTTEATPSQPGCTTALVRNYSSRRGAPVLLGVIHWTGSNPTPGSLAGGLAIVRWFDTPAAQASSNYITDQDGHCWLVVPETQKAWTQAGFNSWSVSVEVVNQGVLPLFSVPRGRATVVRLIRAWHRRWHIPYRTARVSGCTVTRSGFLAHRDLGPCGGGHPDVGVPSIVPSLVAEAAKSDPANRPITTTDRTWCRKLNWWRRHGRPHGKPESNAVRRRVLLGRHHLACRSDGPHRAA